MSAITGGGDLIPPIIVDIISRSTGFAEGVSKAKADMAGLSTAAANTAATTDQAVSNADHSLQEHAGNVKSSMSSIEADVANGLGAIPAGARDAKAGMADAGNASKKLEQDVASHTSRSGGAFKRMAKDVGGALNDLGIPIMATRGKLGEVGAAGEEAGGGLQGLATTGVAAIAIVGAAAVDLGVKMDDVDAHIAAVTGTSLDAAKKIGDAFLGMGGKTEFSGEQLAGAYATVAGQLKATEGRTLSAAQAAKVMAASGSLATATQTDLASATSAVSGVMQAFGLKTRDAAHVSDVLYSASQATGVSVSQLANSLAKARSKLGDTSGSVGDLSTLLADLAEHGVTGRAAMAVLNGSMNTLSKTANGVQTAIQAQKAAYDLLPPSLRKLALEYQNGQITTSAFTKASNLLPASQAATLKSFASATTAIATARTKYEQLGVTVFNQRGQFVGLSSIISQLHPKFADMTQQQKLAAATTIFGSAAARGMVQIISAGPAAYGKASAAVNRHNAALKAAGTEQHSLGGELKVFLTAITDIGTQLGETLLPPLTSMAQAVLPVLVDGLKGAVGIFKDLGAAWKFLGPLHTAILAVVGAVLAWKIGAIALDFVLSANPIGLVVAGIVALIVVVVEVVKHFKEISHVFSDVWEAVKHVTADAIHAVVGFVKQLPGDLLKILEKLPGVILGVYAKVYGTALHLGLDLVKAVLKGAEALGSDLLHLLEKLPGILLQAAVDIGKAALHLGEEIVKGIIGGVGSLGSDLLHKLTGGISGALHGIGHGIGSALHVIGLAEGGIVHKPTLAVVGEAGPEAVIPLKGRFGVDRGGVTDLAGHGGSSGGSITHVGQQHGLHVDNLNVYGNNMSEQQIANELWLKLRPMLTSPAY